MAIIEFPSPSEVYQYIVDGNNAIQGQSVTDIITSGAGTGRVIYFNFGGQWKIELASYGEQEAEALYQYLKALYPDMFNSVGSFAAVVTGWVAGALKYVGAAAGEYLALGTMSLPAAAALIAPLLGVSIGYGLYTLNPTMWEKISRALLPWCYEDTSVMPVVYEPVVTESTLEGWQAYAPKGAVDALRNVFLEAGYVGQRGWNAPWIDLNPAIKISADKWLYNNSSYSATSTLSAGSPTPVSFSTERDASGELGRAIGSTELSIRLGSFDFGTAIYQDDISYSLRAAAGGTTQYYYHIKSDSPDFSYKPIIDIAFSAQPGPYLFRFEDITDEEILYRLPYQMAKVSVITSNGYSAFDELRVAFLFKDDSRIAHRYLTEMLSLADINAITAQTIRYATVKVYEYYDTLSDDAYRYRSTHTVTTDNISGDYYLSKPEIEVISDDGQYTTFMLYGRINMKPVVENLLAKLQDLGIEFNPLNLFMRYRPATYGDQTSTSFETKSVTGWESIENVTIGKQFFKAAFSDITPTLTSGASDPTRVIPNIYKTSTVDGIEIPDDAWGLSNWEGESTDLSMSGIEVVSRVDSGSVVTEPYFPIHPPIGDPPYITVDPVKVPVPTSPVEIPYIEPYLDPAVPIEWGWPLNPPIEIPEGYPEEISELPPLWVGQNGSPFDGKNKAPLNPPMERPDDYPFPWQDPSTDPESQPEPEPEPNPEDDPDYPSPPGAIGITPPISLFPPSGMPSIMPVDGSALIHVYNPSASALASFGSWLWVSMRDTVQNINKLWNNPFDGVIKAMEIFASPIESNTEYIRSGFLTSDVSAPTVRQRYTTINCGSVAVPELYRNYLDYAPYTKVHINLPFCGIYELDSDHIIGHTVNVTYKIDCYTGVCAAFVTVSKENYTATVYSYSGNCGSDLPMSGGSQASLLAGQIQAGAYLASSVMQAMNPFSWGGAIESAAQAANSVLSAKSSVQHSGSFSGNAGAMGIKKPYLIIERPKQISAPNYNKDYGFPAHKRVRIGSCSGYLRVREINFSSSTASNAEKEKIVELLKNGVYTK